MTTDRTGGYSSSDDEVAGARRPISIVIVPGFVLVETRVIQSGLGFASDQALRANRAFAERLHKLSRLVAGRQPDLDGSAGPLDQAQLAQLDDSIKLDQRTCREALKDLRDIGGGLRSKLNQEVVERLRYYEFLRDDVPPERQPALTFQEQDRAPILWEMMHEGSLTDYPPRWEQFWGFRVPITHWPADGEPASDITMRNGLYSATNEDLDFAGREIAQLAQRLKLGLPQGNLASAFENQVRQALRAQMDGDEDKLAAWWQSCQGAWLNHFVRELTDREGGDERFAESWLRTALVASFQDSLRYDLIHFACHCQTSAQTEFLSELQMKVAGTLIPLNVALLASGELRRERRTVRDHGPLVFLNACGTGEQSDSYEPPGFPAEWIGNLSALAVVATLCPVPDYFAHAFALKFYDFLFQATVDSTTPEIARNRYIAEALLATRRYFMETYNNPLGLAYVLYAFKGANILNDFVQVGGVA